MTNGIRLRNYMTREILIRLLLFFYFVYLEFKKPFFRLIQPEEWWLYKYPRKVFHFLKVPCFLKIVKNIDFFLRKNIIKSKSDFSYSKTQEDNDDLLPTHRLFTLVIVLPILVTVIFYIRATRKQTKPNPTAKLDLTAGLLSSSLGKFLFFQIKISQKVFLQKSQKFNF